MKSFSGDDWLIKIVGIWLSTSGSRHVGSGDILCKGMDDCWFSNGIVIF